MEKDKRRKIKKNLSYIFIVIVITGLGILWAPIWQLQSITIEGNEYYSEQELLKALDVSIGDHRLALNLSGIKEKLAQYAYIDTFHISFNGINNLVLEIEESKPIGYVPFNGTYLCIDKKGQVLTQTDQKQFDLPVIDGLEFEKFELKRKLDIKNEDNFLMAIEILEELERQEFIHEVDVIQVKDMRQIHLYVNKLDVIIGDIGNFDRKIMWLKEIQKDYVIGVLDLSMIENEKAILTPLT